MTAKVCLHTKTYENLPKERFTSESSNKPPGLNAKMKFLVGAYSAGGGGLIRAWELIREFTVL